MPAQRKKTTAAQKRALAASTKADWFAHIHSLGLSSVEEYQKWCRQHGFKFNRKKTWRQERQERQIAQLERTNAAALQHIQALGLSSIEEYQKWCHLHGFDNTLNKKHRQRQRELERAAELENGAASSVQNPLPKSTVTLEHIQALGLETIDEYRIWCLENGFSEGLNKKPKLLDKERQLATLTMAKRQMSRLQHTIAQIRAGDIDADDLKTDVLRKIHAAFADQAEDGRAALTQLLQHLERNADLLNTTLALTRWGPQPGNTFVEAVLALGRHHHDWLRPIEAWQPEHRNLRWQFNSLARHLLAHYDVPVAMDTAFFKEQGDAARCQQEWFKHIGRGGNIRSADMPIRFSKMMAHHFLQAPDHYSVEEALRWGQIIGQGGDDELVETLIATHLGRSFENEEFWGTVIHFLARQSMLDPSWIGPIVDYIQQQKYVPQEIAHPDGKVEQMPPPQPNFSMKSRSILKLLRNVDSWRQQQTLAASLPQGQWERSGKGGLSYTEKDDLNDRTLEWSIREIDNHKALIAEGNAMNHCVVSYAKSIEKGAVSIWSMQVKVNTRQRHIMTIAIDNKRRVVTQARGRFNAQPENELQSQALAWDAPDRQPESQLNRNDRDYLLRSYKVLRFWLNREGIAYSQSEA